MKEGRREVKRNKERNKDEREKKKKKEGQCQFTRVSAGELGNGTSVYWYPGNSTSNSGIHQTTPVS